MSFDDSGKQRLRRRHGLEVVLYSHLVSRLAHCSSWVGNSMDMLLLLTSARLTCALIPELTIICYQVCDANYQKFCINHNSSYPSSRDNERQPAALMIAIAHLLESLLRYNIYVDGEHAARSAITCITSRPFQLANGPSHLPTFPKQRSPAVDEFLRQLLGTHDSDSCASSQPSL